MSLGCLVYNIYEHMYISRASLKISYYMYVFMCVLIEVSFKRIFMMSLSDDMQVDITDAYNTTSRYLDDILNINNVYYMFGGKIP